ncbi:MAG: hypothetical protein PWP23_2783 [Candidatus Sumerlaeota bacterium]|nr:hypothetical protein [Candidatus Sumerlaeota bacterium]
MKKLAIFGAAMALGLVSAVPAQTVVQDFDALTAGDSLGGAWRPGYSGTSTVVADATDAESVSDEQAQSGANSAKLTWTWAAASGGVVRVQPTTLVETGPTDHSAEPLFSFAFFGANSGMTIQPYMCDNGNNSGYEAFVNETTDDSTGWKTVEYDITTEPVVSWINGDGTLSTTCEWCGVFFRQGTSTGLQTVYIDDIQYSAPAAVENWSVMAY